MRRHARRGTCRWSTQRPFPPATVRPCCCPAAWTRSPGRNGRTGLPSCSVPAPGASPSRVTRTTSWDRQSARSRCATNGVLPRRPHLKPPATRVRRSGHSNVRNATRPGWQDLDLRPLAPATEEAELPRFSNRGAAQTASFHTVVPVLHEFHMTQSTSGDDCTEIIPRRDGCGRSDRHAPARVDLRPRASHDSRGVAG